MSRSTQGYPDGLITKTPRKLITATLTLTSMLVAANGCCQEWLDHLEDNLHLASGHDAFGTDLSVLLDVEGYYVDQRPPGLLYPDQSFINPRATFFLDSRFGDHFYSLVQARLDRGFDPGDKTFDARLDEYMLRWTPFNDSRLNLQFGKFATVVGNWVQRHDSWENPFITAPLPYENITTVSDEYPPSSPGAFLARRGLPDQKDIWLPVIWGPVYATGGAVFGSIDKFDYAFDVKNGALSSRPDVWDVRNVQWDYPTVSGRLGFRPDPAWSHGVSFSVGPYSNEEAQSGLPSGKNIGDYNQITLASDLGYAKRRWQFWAELFLTRFEVPNVGNADALTYYLESKYKITSNLFAAARWNQQIFGTVPDGAGGHQTWDSNMIRTDLALGYRFNRHLQGKIQYSYGHRDARQQQGEQLVAAQVTLKF